jgi:hypothetical protein
MPAYSSTHTETQICAFCFKQTISPSSTKAVGEIDRTVLQFAIQRSNHEGRNSMPQLAERTASEAAYRDARKNAHASASANVCSLPYVPAQSSQDPMLKSLYLITHRIQLSIQAGKEVDWQDTYLSILYFKSLTYPPFAGFLVRQAAPFASTIGRVRLAAPIIMAQLLRYGGNQVSAVT